MSLWRCAAAQERRPGKGCALRLCLLSATLLLCLLQLGLRRSWDADQPAKEARKPPLPPGARRAEKASEATSRRQVTYVRSGRRRGPAEPTCCLQGAPPSDARKKTIRWHINLQPWASPTASLNNEARRLLKYISTAQISCDHMSMNNLPGNPNSSRRPWSICLDDRFSLVHQIKRKQCRLYSLGLGSDNNQFEISMANSGCEVHRFDPSIKLAHIQKGQRLWYHRLSIDWRDPNPMIAAHKLHTNTKKLGTVLNDFGHHKGIGNKLDCCSQQVYLLKSLTSGKMPMMSKQKWKMGNGRNRKGKGLVNIDILKADMESAEWKILENLILEDVVEHIGQLVLEIHVHWPGFEVSGNDSTVVRYWYSLLKELELKDFRLFHSYKDLSKPQVFLKREAFNASSCYTLSWVNTRWK
ncbi:putative methyltransferase-like protein 24 isoform X1 [Podarcis muralis]